MGHAPICDRYRGHLSLSWKYSHMVLKFPGTQCGNFPFSLLNIVFVGIHISKDRAVDTSYVSTDDPNLVIRWATRPAVGPRKTAQTGSHAAQCPQHIACTTHGNACIGRNASRNGHSDEPRGFSAGRHSVLWTKICHGAENVQRKIHMGLNAR